MSAVLDERERDRTRLRSVALTSAVDSPGTLDAAFEGGLFRAEEEHDRSTHRTHRRALAYFPATGAEPVTTGFDDPVVWSGIDAVTAARSLQRAHFVVTMSPNATELIWDDVPYSDLLEFVGEGASAAGQRDPFEELRDAKAETAKEFVDDWFKVGHVSERLAFRLLSLINMAAEEYPETEIPSCQMLEAAMAFFRSRRGMSTPSLTLTSSGHVWAQWISGERTAAIEFKRDGSVNLVAMFPDPEEPLRRSSMAVSLSWKAASKQVRQNESLRWLLTEDDG